MKPNPHLVCLMASLSHGNKKFSNPLPSLSLPLVTVVWRGMVEREGGGI